MARRHAIIRASCQPLKPLAVPLSSVLIKPALNQKIKMTVQAIGAGVSSS